MRADEPAFAWCRGDLTGGSGMALRAQHNDNAFACCCRAQQNDMDSLGAIRCFASRSVASLLKTARAALKHLQVPSHASQASPRARCAP